MSEQEQASLSAHNAVPKRHRMWIAIVATACCLLLLVQIIRWPLTNLLTVFLEPFLETVLWIVFLVVAAISVGIALYHWKNPRRQTIAPIIACFATAAAVWFVPFNQLYFAADFHLLRSSRTEAAQQALAGKFPIINPGGRGDFIRLPPADHLLSDDGEILVDHRNGKDFVLFFTFRGILDRFSGFVYSPTDTPPAQDEFLGDGIEIERLAPNWYWYAS